MLKRNMKAIVPFLLLSVGFLTEIRVLLLDINISTIYYRNAWFLGIPLFYFGYYMKQEHLKNFWCRGRRIALIIISAIILMVLEFLVCPEQEI